MEEGSFNCVEMAWKSNAAVGANIFYRGSLIIALSRQLALGLNISLLHGFELYLWQLLDRALFRSAGISRWIKTEKRLEYVSRCSALIPGPSSSM